jgi:hypothetical protein
VKVFDRWSHFYKHRCNGRAWREHVVEKSQVLKMHEFSQRKIGDFKWVALKVDYAVEQLLKDSQE